MSLLRITGYRLNKKIDYHYEDGYQHYIKHILAFFCMQNFVQIYVTLYKHL